MNKRLAQKRPWEKGDPVSNVREFSLQSSEEVEGGRVSNSPSERKKNASYLE